MLFPPLCTQSASSRTDHTVFLNICLYICLSHLDPKIHDSLHKLMSAWYVCQALRYPLENHSAQNTMIHDLCVRSWEASHRKWCFNVLSWDLKDEQQLAKEGQETHPKRENAWALRLQATPTFFCISNSTTHGTTITSVIMRWWGRRCEWMEGWKRKN